MQKAFEESRYRMREKIRKEKEIEKNKIRRTHYMLSGLVIACVILISVSGCLQKRAIDKCIKKGNSYNYCVQHS